MVEHLQDLGLGPPCRCGGLEIWTSADFDGTEDSVGDFFLHNAGVGRLSQGGEILVFIGT